MSTHNLCFASKIIPQYTLFCYIKVGYKGVYITRTYFLDVCPSMGVRDHAATDPGCHGDRLLQQMDEGIKIYIK